MITRNYCKSLIFIDDESIRMNSEVYRATLAQIEPHAWTRLPSYNADGKGPKTYSRARANPNILAKQQVKESAVNKHLH